MCCHKEIFNCWPPSPSSTLCTASLDLCTALLLVTALQLSVSVQPSCCLCTEPVFVDLLRSPRIDSQPGEIHSSESIPGLHKNLQIRAQFYGPWPPTNGPACLICSLPSLFIRSLYMYSFSIQYYNLLDEQRTTSSVRRLGFFILCPFSPVPSTVSPIVCVGSAIRCTASSILSFY